MSHWIKSGRPFSRAWKPFEKVNTVRYGDEWCAWWEALGDIGVPGLNGLLSAVISLGWWGMLVRGVNRQPTRAWAVAVGNVTAMIQQRTPVSLVGQKRG